MDVLQCRDSGDKHRLSVPGLGYAVEIPFVLLDRPGGDRLRIASLNLVGQTRLNRDFGRLLAAVVRDTVTRTVGDMQGVAVLSIVEKALQLAQVVAMELDVDEIAVAYNRIKPHMEPSRRPLIQVGVDSITSGDKVLALYERDINILRSGVRGVILVDDVVSTGSTLLGALDLVTACFEEADREPPPVLGVFCAAAEGTPSMTLPVDVHALATLPAPTLVPRDASR